MCSNGEGGKEGLRGRRERKRKGEESKLESKLELKLDAWRVLDGL